jgi:hypothetical protein
MDNLRIKLPAALDGVIQLELYNALDEFFRDSQTWVEEVPFTTELDVLDYELTPTGHARIHQLVGVTDEHYRMIGATMVLPGTVHLLSQHTAGNVLSAWLSLTPADPVSRTGYPFVPEWLLDRYRDTIEAGVMSKMMSQAAKPYSSERLAVYHMRRFRSGIAIARTDAMRQNAYRGQAWRYPSFA